jgi:hypothetical protein
MRVWIATLIDGTVVREGERKWGDVSDMVVSLRLEMDGRVYSLPENKKKYIQAKTMTAAATGGPVHILSRYIGFQDSGTEYCIRVDEQTLNCRMETNEVR